MYAKLAFRNLKRQLSSYIVYFITVIIAVAMMFAVNNVLQSDEIWNYMDGWAQGIIRDLLTIIIAVVTLVVSVIICYATAFLLRKRKKESGTYLLLGIRRKSIILIFVAENSVIAIFSFLCGCLLGIGVFAALNTVIGALTNNVVQPIGLSYGGFMLTLAQWAVIVFVSLIYCSFILGRAKISLLLGEESSVKLHPKYPWIEWVLAVVAFGGICFGAIYGVFILGFSLNGGDTAVVVVGIPTATIILFGSIFLFYLFLRSVFVHKLMRKPACPSAPAAAAAERAAEPTAILAPTPDYGKRAYKKGNIFYLRQMSFAMNRNAVMIGLIAVLLSVAIIAVNITFLLRELSLANIKYRFDVYNLWIPDYEDFYGNQGTPEEMIAEARKYSELSFVRIFYIYDHNFMKLSDYNALAGVLGEEHISLAANEYYIIDTYYPDEKEQIEAYGRRLECTNVSEYCYERNEVVESFNYGYGRNISYLVPDDVITVEAEPTYEFLTMFTEKRLPAAFNDKFPQARNRYREIERINSQYAIAITAAIFLGVTFMLLAMALLAVKALSDTDADRKRYAILHMLGMSADDLRKMLFKQQFNFLIAPLLIPLLLTVPLILAGAVLSDFMLNAFSPIVLVIGFSVPLVYAAIYAAYFAATYYLSVKATIPSERSRIRVLSRKE